MELPPPSEPAPEPAPAQAPEKKRFKLWHKIVASKILVGSIVVHFLFIGGATLYIVQRMETKRKTTFQGGPPQIKASSRALEHQVSMAKKKNTQSAPAQAKRIMTKGLAKISLPEMPTMPNATEIVPNRMAGMGGNGIGFGVGGGGGMGGGGNGFGFELPATMLDRCTVGSRVGAIAANGGDPKDEEVILKGLRWLKQHQNDDGSYGQEYQGAMTGLALLSFMGHCERPTSKEFGANVRKAIDFLVGLGGSSGKLSKGGGNPWVYEHGIATYALAESYILTKEVKIADVLKNSVRMIVEGQGADGGWEYNFAKSGAGDTSVSGWQIQALKAAILTRLNIDGADGAMRNAMNDIMRVKGPKGGFGYRGPEDRPGLSGVGVLSLEVGRHERGLAVRQGLHFIEEEAFPKISWESPDANLYAWYYITQACFQYGGSPWHKWNREFQAEIVGHQDADGGWPETGSKDKGGGLRFYWTGTGSTIDAQVYRTSLCILMLEVYYRYLASSRA